MLLYLSYKKKEVNNFKNVFLLNKPDEYMYLSLLKKNFFNCFFKSKNYRIFVK